MTASLRIFEMLPGPALQLANANSVRFWSLKFASAKYLVITWSMYLAPAWMLDSVTVMSPTLSDAPVAGITCMTPIAPTWLLLLWSSVDS